MASNVTVRRQVVKRQPRRAAPRPAAAPRIPRISRLMAFAVVADEMIRRGEAQNYAELARLGHVSPARMTQIMALLNLAPSIQEALLNLPPTTDPSPITERHLRPIAATSEWAVQERCWGEVDGYSALCPVTLLRSIASGIMNDVPGTDRRFPCAGRRFPCAGPHSLLPWRS